MPSSSHAGEDFGTEQAKRSSLINPSAEMRLPALSQPPVSGHTCNTHTERRGGGWLKQQILSLFPWLREVVSGVAVGRGRSVCWTGFVMRGLRAWERLADPTHPISLPLAQKLQGNHFLAAFPPPL